MEFEPSSLNFKICLRCSKSFQRPVNVAYNQFSKRKFCSKACWTNKSDKEALERLLAKVEKTDSCWLFSGATVRGYGQIRFKGKTCLAHRVSFQLHKGEIPKNKELLHSCDVPNCVNPDHLSVGTRSDNMQDCVKKGRYKPSRYNIRKTHCPEGHPYHGKNLKLEKSGHRKCRICSNKRRMENYYAKTRKRS